VDDDDDDGDDVDDDDDDDADPAAAALLSRRRRAAAGLPLVISPTSAPSSRRHDMMVRVPSGASMNASEPAASSVVEYRPRRAGPLGMGRFEGSDSEWRAIRVIELDRFGPRPMVLPRFCS
jgi:hypothetical protein